MRVEFRCETCGVPGARRYPSHRIPKHFFCSVPCQNEWQKTREDIRIKNRDPHFRAKVSAGLKRRKERLGTEYHSEKTREKIGRSTRERWKLLPEQTREQILTTLRSNAHARRTYGPYDARWQQLSSEMRQRGVCRRCGSSVELVVHHIIPVRVGGSREKKNLVVLCQPCHPKVEKQQRILFSLLHDWDLVQLLVRERLGMCP